MFYRCKTDEHIVIEGKYYIALSKSFGLFVLNLQNQIIMER